MTWRLVRDPVGLVGSLARRYGDPYELWLMDGERNVVTGRPDLLKAIFTAPPGHVDSPADIVEPLVGRHSIVVAQGERHKRKRKLMMPPFHGSRMRAYAHIIQEAATRAVAGLTPGQELNLLERTQRLSLEVIVRALFGVTDEARARELRQVVAATVDGLPTWLIFLRPLHHDLLGMGPWARYQRDVSDFIALLRREIVRARRETGRDDVLAMLVAARDEAGEPMPDAELIDELRTLVIAGHETTSAALATGIRRVIESPPTLARLREELAPLGPLPDPEALSHLPYVGAVCDEILRFHPVAPVLRRRAVKPLRLGDHEVPAGTMLSPALAITHFDPAIYPDPWTFRPERFLERSYSPFEFLPFGGGSRRCVGAAFATFELRIALGTMLAGWSFGRVDSGPIRLVMNGVTSRPVGGVPLRFLGPRTGGAQELRSA